MSEHKHDHDHAHDHAHDHDHDHDHAHDHDQMPDLENQSKKAYSFIVSFFEISFLLLIKVT